VIGLEDAMHTTVTRLLAGVLSLGLLLGSAPVNAQSVDPQAVASDRTPPRLSYADGDVSFWRPGAQEWAPAQINTPIAPGDELYTGQGGTLELQVSSRAFVRAWGDTQLGLASQDADVLQIRVTTGHVSLDFREVPPGRAVELNTPGAAFTIDRPGYYRVDVEPPRTRFTARRTSQSVTMTVASGGAIAIAPGEQVIIDGDAAPRIERVSTTSLDVWDRWNDDRSAQLFSLESSRYVSADVSGLADLDRYGRWRSTPTYGSVWVPSSVPSGWAPYSTGKWIWDPYYGWTWVDTAPWGWAPYHYGRWVTIDSGIWAWAPGPIVVRPVFAPALVAFFGFPGVRVGITAPSLSWVALGWGEPLIPWWGRSGYIGRPHWRGWGGPRVVNNVVINNQTNININNITYRNVNVRNSVVAVRERDFGRRPVQQARVSDVNPRELRPVRGALDVKPDAASFVPSTGRATRPPETVLNRRVVTTPQRAAVQDRRNDRERPDRDRPDRDRDDRDRPDATADRPDRDRDGARDQDRDRRPDRGPQDRRPENATAPTQRDRDERRPEGAATPNPQDRRGAATPPRPEGTPSAPDRRPDRTVTPAPPERRPDGAPAPSQQDRRPDRAPADRRPDGATPPSPQDRRPDRAVAPAPPERRPDGAAVPTPPDRRPDGVTPPAPPRQDRGAATTPPERRPDGAAVPTPPDRRSDGVRPPAPPRQDRNAVTTPPERRPDGAAVPTPPDRRPDGVTPPAPPRQDRGAATAPPERRPDGAVRPNAPDRRPERPVAPPERRPDAVPAPQAQRPERGPATVAPDRRPEAAGAPNQDRWSDRGAPAPQDRDRRDRDTSPDPRDRRSGLGGAGRPAMTSGGPAIAPPRPAVAPPQAMPAPAVATPQPRPTTPAPHREATMPERPGGQPPRPAAATAPRGAPAPGERVAPGGVANDREQRGSDRGNDRAGRQDDRRRPAERGGRERPQG
jgi:hypothetical protein